MKNMFFAVLLLIATAQADELTAWRKGFSEGAEAGYKLCRIEDVQKLKSYEDLVNSIFNTKSLMFAGRFPLPAAYQRVEVVRKPDGTAEIVRKWEVLPPAYFPVKAVESLKQEFTGGDSVVPAGWGVVVKTDSLPIEKIAYAYYSGTKLFLSPVYLPDSNLLVLSVFGRKADALNAVSKLEAYGVDCELEKIEKPIRVKKFSPPIQSELLFLSKKLKEKEEKLLGIQSSNESMDSVISALNKVIATAQSLESSSSYSDFDFLQLQKDVESIRNNVLSYLQEKEPYRRVIFSDPFEKERNVYMKTIEKLKEEVLKLEKENRRLRHLCGEKDSGENSIIKKYLKGEL